VTFGGDEHLAGTFLARQYGKGTVRTCRLRPGLATTGDVLLHSQACGTRWTHLSAGPGCRPMAYATDTYRSWEKHSTTSLNAQPLADSLDYDGGGGGCLPTNCNSQPACCLPGPIVTTRASAETALQMGATRGPQRIDQLQGREGCVTMWLKYTCSHQIPITLTVKWDSILDVVCGHVCSMIHELLLVVDTLKLHSARLGWFEISLLLKQQSA